MKGFMGANLRGIYDIEIQFENTANNPLPLMPPKRRHIGSAPDGSKKMKEEEKTYYDNKIKWLKNKPIIAYFLLAFVLIIGLAEFKEAYNKLLPSKSKIIQDEKQPVIEITQDTIKNTETKKANKFGQNGNQLKKNTDIVINKNDNPPTLTIDTPSQVEIKLSPQTILYDFSILSNNNASIYINNIFVGKSPVGIELPEGFHNIKIKLGKDECEDVVQIPKQKILTLKIEECGLSN